MNEEESGCQMCPAAIFDRCSDVSGCHNVHEGQSSGRTSEFSFGWRAIISHMWEILTFSINSKEFLACMRISKANIMVEMQWGLRKAKNLKYLRVY